MMNEASTETLRAELCTEVAIGSAVCCALFVGHVCGSGGALGKGANPNALGPAANEGVVPNLFVVNRIRRWDRGR
jgi:hypothetical protein